MSLWKVAPSGRLANSSYARYFGPGALGPSEVFGVVDPYEHPLDRAAGHRFVKRMRGRSVDRPIFGADEVVGVGTMRFVSYATAAFAKLSTSGRPLSILPDHELLARWQGTFICYGSSDSNLKTYDIERLPEQTFYRLVFGPDGFRCWDVGGQRFSAAPDADHAILLRMRNPHFPEYLLFVCAGLSEWGSTGAAYYLFANWEVLRRQFGGQDFCCVLRVTLESDQSARLVHSVVR